MEPKRQIVRCLACGAANRVPLDKLRQGSAPICGKCRTPLAMDRPVLVTDATFAEEVEGSGLPVLVDMWAEWCGPCRMIAPMIEELARDMAGRLRVAKLNVDENPATASRFGIQSIPAMLVFRDGREVDRFVGARPKTDIVDRLRRWLV